MDQRVFAPQRPRITAAAPPVRSPVTTLQTNLDELPTDPGVYVMRDVGDDVLYVGKAVDLRARVKQYFAGGDGRFHVGFLVPRIQRVEVQVTRTEREALILEDTLIKKFQPPYNVKLKDDKTWLSIRLNQSERWPRVTLVRRWKDDGARYFGPYLNEVKAREVVKLLKRTIPLRTCTDSVFRAHSERPCIEFQMGRCSAPCVGKIDEGGYDDLVTEARLLLEGRNTELVRKLKERMGEASERLEFESAARLRDNIALIGRLAEKQVAHDAPGSKAVDAFALHREGELASVAMLPRRGGRLQDARAFAFHNLADDDDELLGRLITQLYSATVRPPPEILVPLPIADMDLRAELLSEIAGHKVVIRVPMRGKGRQVLDLAQRNAEVRFQAAHSKTARSEQALGELQRLLRLPRPPRNIECYDNSNIQGTDPVGAMVTFRDAVPHKKGYRIFKIKTVVGADDYASMTEVLSRRFTRALNGDEGWALPDLVVIDGGRGQLSMVTQVCQDLGVQVAGPDGQPIGAWSDPSLLTQPTIRLVAISKPREGEATDKIYEPGRSNPVGFKPHSAGLHVLQRARDEAHRFGVSHHRKQRKKRTLTSELDTIAGIGPTLRKRLLTTFGSVTKVKRASVEAIAAVPGMGRKRAEAVAEALKSG